MSSHVGFPKPPSPSPRAGRPGAARGERPSAGALAIALGFSLALAGCGEPRPDETTMLGSPSWPVEPGDAVERPRAGAMATPERRMAPAAADGWERMAVPTGDPATSAIAVSRRLPETVRVDETFGYRLVVENLTDMTWNDVRVAEAPENMEIVSASPEPRMTDGAAEWMLGSLGPREREVINIEARPREASDVTACATVSYETGLCSSARVVRPAVQLVKRARAEGERVLACDPTEIVLEVQNTGSAVLRDLEVTDELPPGLRRVDGGRTVSLQIDELGPGETVRFPVMVRADDPGRYASVARVRGDGVNASSDEMELRFVRPQLELELSAPETSYLREQLCTELLVRNVGDGVAREGIVQQRIPEGADLVSVDGPGGADGDLVTWRLPPLAPGEERTLTACFEVQELGDFRTRATARAYCADAVSAEAETKLRGIPAILIEVVDLRDPVPVGENTTYVITVTNQGTQADTGIRLVGIGGEGQRLLSTDRGRIEGRTARLATIASLAPGASEEFRVEVRADVAGDIRFTVEMTSDQLTEPVVVEEATRAFE